jgi:pimeloyl-ACP methyl ester carboxylesterase
MPGSSFGPVEQIDADLVNVGRVDAGRADGPEVHLTKLSEEYSHRLPDGIGHNVPQEAPEAFANAVLEVGGGAR